MSTNQFNDGDSGATIRAKLNVVAGRVDAALGDLIGSDDSQTIANKVIDNTNTIAAIDTHLGDVNNPHSVTKEQVGLSNIVDSGSSTAITIDSSNNTVVNLLTAQKLTSTADAGLHTVGISEGTEAASLALTSFSADKAININKYGVVGLQQTPRSDWHLGVADMAVQMGNLGVMFEESSTTFIGSNAYKRSSGGYGAINHGWSSLIQYDSINGGFNFKSSDALGALPGSLVTLQTLLTVAADGGVHVPLLKSGTSQANANAVAGELWRDSADNSIKQGV